MIEVDARSGQVFGLVLSEDGRTLSGAVVHGGCFTFTLSDPADPHHLEFRSNQNLQEHENPLPCR